MRPNTKCLTDYVDSIAPLEAMPAKLAFLRGIEPGFDCFALYDRGENYGFAAIRPVGDGTSIEIHLVMTRFGPQKLKKLRDQFAQFQRWCAHQGVLEVCTFKLPGADEDHLWHHFVDTLGFDPVQTMYLTQKQVEAG